MLYIKRHIEKKIITLLKNTSIITLTGARQSGKSTLLKHLLNTWEYVSFDNIQFRESASKDPELFLKKYSDKVIFDEVQKVPDLFHEVKLQVDNDRDKRFILSGSSNFLLMSNITESLAGRTSICELFPFSLSELHELKKDKSFLEKLWLSSVIEEAIPENKNDFTFNEIINTVLLGGFPKITQIKDFDEKINWFQN